MNAANISKLGNDSIVIGKDTDTVSLYLSESEVAGLVLFLAFFGFVGVFQNLVVILSIIHTDGFLDVPANTFVLSLAFSDALVCGVCAPLLIYNCFEWIFTVFVTVSKLIVVATTGSIFLITVNRFVSIVRPLKYSMIITYKRALAMVGGIWILAALFPSLAIIGLVYQIKTIVHLTRYILSFYILSCSAMYAYMYILAKKHRSQLLKLKYAITGQTQTCTDEFKSLHALFLVAGSFAACWLPMTVAFFFTDRNTDPSTFYRAFSFTAPLAVVNAVLDPTIYYYKSKGFRNSLKVLAKTFQNAGSWWDV